MKNIASGLVILSCIFIGCSSSLQLTSRWHTNDTESWQDSAKYIKDQNLAVDIGNDDEYVYLSFVAGDRRTLRQIFFRGLTVWFDHAGGNEKRFGIRYPTGTDIVSMGERPRRSEGTPDTSFIFPEQLPQNLEILGPGENEHHLLTFSETKGVTVTIDNQGGSLMYRLKVPLMDNRGHLYGVGAQPGETIGIGIETGESVHRQEGGEQPSGGSRRGGSREGPGGYRGRGMGGPPIGGFGGRPEPLNFWMKIQLATNIHS
ncbi:MAG: hypothetical protein HY033_06575 [Ignavibacteriae bacterium]|nr:hypothetical protein [Ignavibacteria bacterium]MBI3364556.1 hypothetical protein [Ignavibacteriota bacterium]